MKTVTCSVDGCGHNATTDIYPEDDSRAFLCADHFEQTNRAEWLTFTVGGRELLLDTAGTFWDLPERDEELHDLARKEGLP